MLTQGRIASITSTPDHPYWLANREGFYPASQIQTNDVLETAHGSFPTVTSVVTHEDTEKRYCYDLDIEDYDTFFVGDNRVWVHNHDPKCVKFYRIVQKLIVRGVPDNTGKLIKPADEWRAMQYLILALCKKPPGIDRIIPFTKEYIFQVFAIHAGKVGRVVNGKQVFTPGRVLPYSQTDNLAGRLKDCQFHHYWPKHYMKNEGANYKKSMTFEVSTPLHKSEGLGFDYELDMHIAKEMQAYGFVIPGGGIDGAGKFKKYEKARKATVAFWNAQPEATLPTNQKAAILRKFYAEYSIDMPNIGLDGVPIP